MDGCCWNFSSNRAVLLAPTSSTLRSVVSARPLSVLKRLRTEFQMYAAYGTTGDHRRLQRPSSYTSVTYLPPPDNSLLWPTSCPHASASTVLQSQWVEADPLVIGLVGISAVPAGLNQALPGLEARLVAPEGRLDATGDKNKTSRIRPRGSTYSCSATALQLPKRESLLLREQGVEEVIVTEVGLTANRGGCLEFVVCFGFWYVWMEV